MKTIILFFILFLGIQFSLHAQPVTFGDAVFTGKVGIKVTNPSKELEVNGTIKAINSELSGSGDIGSAFSIVNSSKTKNEEHVNISEACVTWVMNELVPQNVVLNGSEGWNTGVARAGNSITLKPGFSTVPGKTFHASISPLQPCAKSVLKSTDISDDDYSISNQQDFPSDLKVENNSEVSISAFPNPNNGRFCIQVKNAENIDHVAVVNIQGVTIYRDGNDAYNEIFIDITNQPSGVYFVNVSLNGKVQTTKIIKN
jgi:hypothetical protein